MCPINEGSVLPGWLPITASRKSISHRHTHGTIHDLYFYRSKIKRNIALEYMWGNNLYSSVIYLLNGFCLPLKDKQEQRTWSVGEKIFSFMFHFNSLPAIWVSSKYCLNTRISVFSQTLSPVLPDKWLILYEVFYMIYFYYAISVSIWFYIFGRNIIISGMIWSVLH